MKMNHIVICIEMYLKKKVQEPLHIVDDVVKNIAVNEGMENWYIAKINDNTTGRVAELKIPVHEIMKLNIDFETLYSELENYYNDFIFSNMELQSLTNTFKEYLDTKI